MIKVIVRLKDKIISHHTLEKPEIVIGRDGTSDVPIDNPLVSRHHAKILQEGNGYVLQDLQSANGCFLKGQKVEGKVPLSEGDQIEIGKFQLEVHMAAAGSAPASAAPKPHHQDDVLMTMQVDVRSLREQLKNAPVRPSVPAPAASEPAAPAPTTPASAPAAANPARRALAIAAGIAIGVAIFLILRKR